MSIETWAYISAQKRERNRRRRIEWQHALRAVGVTFEIKESSGGGELFIPTATAGEAAIVAYPSKHRWIIRMGGGDWEERYGLLQFLQYAKEHGMTNINDYGNDGAD